MFKILCLEQVGKVYFEFIDGSMILHFCFEVVYSFVVLLVMHGSCDVFKP